MEAGIRLWCSLLEFLLTVHYTQCFMSHRLHHHPSPPFRDVGEFMGELEAGRLAWAVTPRHLRVALRSHDSDPTIQRLYELVRTDPERLTRVVGTRNEDTFAAVSKDPS